MVDSAASPASTGPAGPLFEAEVAAYYLLAMLVGAEARGLPGVRIMRIKLQRGSEGHPLDDVIVEGRDERGTEATLDIQVKRAITFAPSDVVFAKVSGQIAETLRSGASPQRMMAVATSQSSRQIDGPYQDLLAWAAQIGDAETFFGRLARKGSSNPAMRTFVETLKGHLEASGVATGDEGLWTLLRRLQIFVFDFTAIGSSMKLLSRELCIRALAAGSASRAGDLWDALVKLAMDIAAQGGDRTAQALRIEIGKRFQLAATSDHLPALTVLDEAAGHALDDIDDRIAGSVLLRPEKLDRVHGAMDQGRLVQITGAGGVGKSGVLKHIASAIRRQSRLILLTPERTPVGGWASLKAILGFPGSARDLIVELAASGGGAIVIDSLDNFTPGARATAMDLIAEAARVPGVWVLITSRRALTTEDDNGVAESISAALGMAAPVIVDDLSDDEVEALVQAEPALAPLLANDHPARQIARNLFRLRRLLATAGDEAAAPSEIALARQWWTSGDGPTEGRRERSRLLRALSEAAVRGDNRIDARDHPSNTIEALIRSGSVRDLGGDRLIFGHDVLRDWGVANLLEDLPDQIGFLPLSGPAPPILARGIELWARRGAMGGATLWQERLGSLTGPSRHGSWRRAVMLALVRGEAIDAQLDLMEEALLQDKGRLLTELLGTVAAVEVRQAVPFFRTLGITGDMIPDNLMVPVGHGWLGLVGFIQRRQAQLPPAVLPEVVKLYLTWLSAVAQIAPGCTTVVDQLFLWLEHAEDERGFGRPSAFGGEFDRAALDSLTRSLRLGATAFAWLAPTATETYLARLSGRPEDSAAVADILSRPGSIPATAPETLARLTGDILIAPIPEGRGRGLGSNGFSFNDHLFMPASPAQGPFIGLLKARPDVGLGLIHRLVRHAKDVAQARGPLDQLKLESDGGPVVIDAMETYWFSREVDSEAVHSALMALEAWSHERIEAGEPIATVVADILSDPEGVLGAFVLVAIDILLSHWGPDAVSVAAPFAASPEIVALDRARWSHDSMPGMPLLDFGGFYSEPGKGELTAAALSRRPSRRFQLEQVHVAYVFDETGLGERMRERISRAVTRLGPPDPDAPFTDPAYMATSMANFFNRENWVDAPDGSGLKAYAGAPADRTPEAIAARSRSQNLDLDLRIGQAVDDASMSSAALAAEAAARRPTLDEEGDLFVLEPQHRLAAAFVAARDAEADVWSRDGADVIAICIEALTAETHGVERGRRFRNNPRALAFAGLAHALSRDKTPDILSALLNAAALGEREIGMGFAAVAPVLVEIDPNLPEALLRAAFVGTRRIHRSAFEDAAELPTWAAIASIRRAAAEAEAAWLLSGGPRPAWPCFVPTRPAVRQGIQLPLAAHVPAEPIEPPSENRLLCEPENRHVYTAHDAAAAWLDGALILPRHSTPWLVEVIDQYLHWTYVANGLGPEFGVNSQAASWNQIFFRGLARATPLIEDDVVSRWLAPLNQLSEKSLLAIAPSLLLGVDVGYFDEGVVTPERAVMIRTCVSDAVMAGHLWRDASRRWSTSAEVSFGPAVASLFFSEQPFGQAPRPYLAAKHIAQLAPLAPLLARLLTSGPSYLVAISWLAVVEIAPTADLLEPLLAGAEAWQTAFPTNRTFWSDHGVGQRFSAIAASLLDQSPDLFAAGGAPRQRLEAILPSLTAMGVSKAHELEQRLLG